jgi:hypothetical protein
MMTEELKKVFEKMCMSYNENVPLFWREWTEVSENVAIDMKGLVSQLVVNADILAEMGSSEPRKVYRGRSQPVQEIAKLAWHAPWSELLVTSSNGEVRLSEGLTNDDLSELCRIYSNYASCISDAFPDVRPTSTN